MTQQPDHTCVVGLGWGDEGKGKIVDLLCSAFDVVVRYNGGANAGHTVCVGDETFALHLVPSGVLHDGMTGVIGPGVVVDPAALIEEMDALEARGVEVASRLRISDRAHLVMPYHKIEDRLEDAGSVQRIGTTSRGIGPCYADKMRRGTAVRMVDLLDFEALAGRLRAIVDRRSRVLKAMFSEDGGLNADQVIDQLRPVASRLGPMIGDVSLWLGDQIDAGKRLLFEGANGMLLDVDHGTYPFVTSSQTGPHGIAGGAGVPAQLVTHRIGVTKAYSTRVGEGPFPTELTGPIGDRIREQGHEYGTTTGRPRRCGWLDGVAMRYSVRIGGITELALAHLDTLSGFEQVGFCTAYECRGRTLDSIPARASDLAEVRPIFEMQDGWNMDLRGVLVFEDLPDAAQRYIRRIEQFVSVPVSILSVGPQRSQTILRADPWKRLATERALA